MVGLISKISFNFQLISEGIFDISEVEQKKKIDLFSYSIGSLNHEPAKMDAFRM